MTGICGWFAPGMSLGSEQTLRAMSGGLTTASVTYERSKVRPDCAAHVQGGRRSCWFSADETIWASIAGRPRWSQPDLDRLAREGGQAVALAEAYRRFDLSLLQRLFGPFSLAVADRSTDRILLAVDRFGIHTLSYALAQGGIVYGSTCDVLRIHPCLTATLRPQGIFEYFAFGFLWSPKGIFDEHKKLRPAECLLFENGRIDSRSYWRMPYGAKTEQSPSDLKAHLKTLLVQAVDRAIDNEDGRAIGSFLSGGLDSTTISGILAWRCGNPVKTFTIGFDDPRFDETAYARDAAAHFKTDHHERKIGTAHRITYLKSTASQFDEPFGNASSVPVHSCAEFARDTGINVLLAGDGGDELFAGNSRYVNQKILNIYQALPPTTRHALVECILDHFPNETRWAIIRKAKNYVRMSNIPMPARMELGNEFRSTPLADLFEPEFCAAISPWDLADSLREHYLLSETDNMLQRMMHFDLKFALADNDLRKVGRMCAVAGVDVRFPFLDEDLAAFAAGIPPHQMLKGFRLRSFFKDALSDFLPPSILAKPKHGFAMAPAEGHEFNEIARDLLGTFRDRRYLKADFVDVLERPPPPCEPPSLVRRLRWWALVLEVWLRSRGL